METEIIKDSPAPTCEEHPDNLLVEKIRKGEVKYSQWKDRDKLWWYRNR